jgi:threonine dehydrogenase-like Zn-dependent dehydrogenase
MRAMVIDRPQSVAVQDTDPPAPGPGEVLVQLEGCGVCGSNLPVWLGQPWFSYPLPGGAPGHEGWGIVHATGQGVDDIVPGTRVACLSSHAFAEFDMAPADAIVGPLPDALAGRPFPGEALACAVNIVRRAAPQPGERIAVVGIGFIGALVVRLATVMGARVTAISRRRYALDVAASQGAETLVPFRDLPGTVSEALAIAGPDGYGAVIEAVGSQEALDLSSALPAVRGRLVIAGYHQDGPRQVDLQSWNWRGLDVINAHERSPQVYVDGLREAIQAVTRGDWDPSALVTHVLPLEELDRALSLLAERPDGFLKAVVVP